MADRRSHVPGTKSVLTAPAAKLIGKEHQAVWKLLPKNRRALLKLLSRFEITPDQAQLAFIEEVRAKAAMDCTDAELLASELNCRQPVTEPQS